MSGWVTITPCSATGEFTELKRKRGTALSARVLHVTQQIRCYALPVLSRLVAVQNLSVKMNDKLLHAELAIKRSEAGLHMWLGYEPKVTKSHPGSSSSWWNSMEERSSKASLGANTREDRFKGLYVLQKVVRQNCGMSFRWVAPN